jgi:hypothetical protein
MFYDRAQNVPAGSESGNDRVPVNRVLQRVDVPWTAPGSSECRFRMLRSQPHDGVSVAKLVRPQLRPRDDWLTAAT